MSICHNRIRVTVAPGFLLLSALLFYLDDGIGILPWVLLSAMVHEGGHIGASILFGGKVEAAYLSIVGAELRFSYSSPLSYLRENVVALAGPAVNLVVGCVLVWCGRLVPGMMSLYLGLFNLLPVCPLDGGRILFNVIAEYFGLSAAERVMMVSGGICIGIFVGLGVIAAVEYMNFTIIFGAAWLLFVAVGRVDKKSAKK